MKNQSCFIMLILFCLVVGCKSGILKSLASAQEWSENYALLDGTTCTSAEMIDGNLETVGTTGHWIIVTLPQRKSVHRIVIKGTNIEDVIVYESLGGEGNWRKIEQIKNNVAPTIDMRVRVITDGIRFRVGGTFDDKRIAGQYDPRYDAVRNRQVKRGHPYAQEIELYGFADKKAANDK